jgi:hypothetical protein
VIGGARSTHGRDGDIYTEIWSDYLKRRDHLGGIHVDGTIILKPG